MGPTKGRAAAPEAHHAVEAGCDVDVQRLVVVVVVGGGGGFACISPTTLLRCRRRNVQPQLAPVLRDPVRVEVEKPSGAFPSSMSDQKRRD
jgi:hypothetical protein